MSTPQPSPQIPTPADPSRVWRHLGCGGMTVSLLGLVAGALLLLEPLGMGFIFLLAGGGPESWDSLPNVNPPLLLVLVTAVLFIVSLAVWLISLIFRRRA